MLERVGQTARILDMHHHTMVHESTQNAAHSVIEVALWLSLLRSCSGYDAFMKKHHGRVTANTAVGFLLFDVSFPRSFCYCLQAAQGLLQRVWKNDGGDTPRASVQEVQGLLEWLEGQSHTKYVEHIHEVLTHVVDRTAIACGLIGSEILKPPMARISIGATVS